MCCKVKEEASQSRLSDTLHVDPSGQVTLTTPNRLATVSVRAIPLPQGKTRTGTRRYNLCMPQTNWLSMSKVVMTYLSKNPPFPFPDWSISASLVRIVTLDGWMDV